MTEKHCRLIFTGAAMGFALTCFLWAGKADTQVERYYFEFCGIIGAGISMLMSNLNGIKYEQERRAKTPTKEHPHES